jgi:hypothetical protein
LIVSMTLRHYFGIIGICMDLIVYPLSVGPVARLAMPRHSGGGLVAAPEWFTRAYRPLFTTVRKLPPCCSEAMMNYLRYWLPQRYASED